MSHGAIQKIKVASFFLEHGVYHTLIHNCISPTEITVLHWKTVPFPFLQQMYRASNSTHSNKQQTFFGTALLVGSCRVMPMLPIPSHHAVPLRFYVKNITTNSPRYSHYTLGKLAQDSAVITFLHLITLIQPNLTPITTTTITTTTIRLSGVCPGQPGWATFTHSHL